MSIELIDFLQIYAERDPTTIAAAPPAERRTRFPAAGKLERHGNAHLATVHGFDAAPLPFPGAWRGIGGSWRFPTCAPHHLLAR
jgi:hypothetical protein